MLRRIALTASSAFLLVGAAQAGDYPGGYGYDYGPAYAAVNWSGFYAGVNAGYAWSNDNQLVDPSEPFWGVSPAGGFAGGQIGYSWQGIMHPYLVLGIEADIQGSGISDSQYDGYGAHYKSDLDYFGTFRGRIGYAANAWLLYFTGGLAYGGLHKLSNDFGPQTFDGTAVGYVVGGGLEYKITPAWSVKAEYQYLNFGRNDACGSGSCFGPDVVYYGYRPQGEDDYQTFRIGANYHFAPGYEPIK